MAKEIWIKGIQFLFTNALPDNYGIELFTSETIFQYIKQNIKATKGGLKELAKVKERFVRANKPSKLEWRFAQPPLAESEQDDWQIEEISKPHKHAWDRFRIVVRFENQKVDKAELEDAYEVMRELVKRFIHSHQAVIAWKEQLREEFEKTKHERQLPPFSFGSSLRMIDARFTPYCFEIGGSRYELPKSIDTLFEDNSLSMNILSNDKPLKSVKRKVYSKDSLFDF